MGYTSKLTRVGITNSVNNTNHTMKKHHISNAVLSLSLSHTHARAYAHTHSHTHARCFAIMGCLQLPSDLAIILTGRAGNTF